MSPQARSLWIGGPLLVLLFLAALQWGSVSDLQSEWILQLRFPRAILALSVGASLAIAGALLQAVFHNPLCEPYTLGISSGSVLGSVIALHWGWVLHWNGFNIGALVGALAFTALLLAASRSGRVSVQSLLLLGVMLSLLGSSAASLWLSLMDPSGVQGVLFWLLGDLSVARLGPATLLFALTLIVLFLAWARGPHLDGLLLGDEMAVALGVDVHRARQIALTQAAVLVSISVSLAGMIGFVGLVVPHFVRRLVGSRHRILLPHSALWGAILLLGSDVLARVLLRPNEIPSGVVSALWGSPVFIYLLLSRRTASWKASLT